MKTKLAGLVRPDNTPVETLEPSPPDETEKGKRPPGIGRPFARARDRVFGDWIVVAAGFTLALTCAMFPWYIFLHQEEFGVRPLRFESARTDEPSSLDYEPDLAGTQIPFERVEPEFDQSPTTTASANEDRAAPPSSQPFPGDAMSFRLVYAGSGRAMIEDADGFWVVQRGSRLPDGSRVARIEQRSGKWVLVTSLDEVLPLSR